MIHIDFSSRVRALRSVGAAVGAPDSSMPGQTAAISDISCLYWINRLRAFVSLPPLPGLDYHGFVGAINDILGAGTAPPTGAQWSAADANASTPPMVLSNGGQTVAGSGAATWASIRGPTSKSSGKLYYEFSTSAPTLNPGAFMIGLASSDWLPANTYPGHGNYSMGINNITGYIYSSVGFSGSPLNIDIIGDANANDVWGFAVDFSAQTMWVALNNVWVLSGNPAIGANPSQSFTLATTGPLFPTLGLKNPNSGAWTLHSAAGSLKYAPPTGFSAWG